MADPKGADKKAAVKKVKQPSALKRNLQSQKRRLSNRSFKATVLTSIRALEGAISQKLGEEELKVKLCEIYSLLDKGVKKGVFKTQKAARTKSRLSAKSTI